MTLCRLLCSVAFQDMAPGLVDLLGLNDDPETSFIFDNADVSMSLDRMRGGTRGGRGDEEEDEEEEHAADLSMIMPRGSVSHLRRTTVRHTAAARGSVAFDFSEDEKEEEEEEVDSIVESTPPESARSARGAKSAAVLDRCFDVAQRLNGLGATQEEIAKN